MCAACCRSGYYPPLFYPKIGALAKEFIPLFTQAFYLHNFKGGGGGENFFGARQCGMECTGTCAALSTFASCVAAGIGPRYLDLLPVCLLPAWLPCAGALFRVYPEPWQVLRRDRGGLRVVHTQEEMPSLKEVALDILPRHP